MPLPICGDIPLSFGSLGHAGGERRLNVAITRARRQIVLFASFDPEDLRVEQSAHQGLRDLRAYLEQARSGSAPGVWHPGATHRDRARRRLDGHQDLGVRQRETVKRRTATQLLGVSLGGTLFAGFFFTPALPAFFGTEVFANGQSSLSKRDQIGRAHV